MCQFTSMQVTLSLVNSGMLGGVDAWDGELLAWGGLWHRISYGWIQRPLQAILALFSLCFIETIHVVIVCVFLHSVFCLRTQGQLKMLIFSPFYFIRFIPSHLRGNKY